MSSPETILADARKLRDDRFKLRDAMLKKRSAERFNQTSVDVPTAYQKRTKQHESNIIEDEGRQIATLVYAMPTPHLTPPTPQDQPLTTKVEQFLIAMHEELERKHGPVWRQCTLAQVHDNIGWIFFCPKRKAYPNQPQAVSDDASEEEKYDYGVRNERHKKDAGISAVFDYQFAPTGTILHEGNVFDPHCLYVWKEVPESTLRKRYGIGRQRDGKFSKENLSEPGYMPDSQSSEKLVTIVEYWDRNECVIVAEENSEKWLGTRQVKSGFELDRWKHDLGRVPYFARPAFPTEQLDKDKEFSGPLDGIYTEMPEHKLLRTMGSAISYQTAFSPLQVLTVNEGELILDDNNEPMTFLDLEPGKARQMAPGQRIEVIPQSPEVRNFFAEMQASEMRIARFSLPPVAKGQSPGADTANAALSNLHRFNLSMLDPMADHTALQANAMYRLALEVIQKIQEPVFVLDNATDAYLSLSAEDIISVNVQTKAVPDQGQQQLLIEKHATELWVAGAITETEMHEMRGKENPEDFTLANAAERLRKMLEPVVMQQIIADLGMLDAVNQMIQANAESGSARGAVPGLMGQVEQMNSGMGQGRPGQPRANGRGIDPNVNTQQGQANGY